MRWQPALPIASGLAGLHLLRGHEKLCANEAPNSKEMQLGNLGVEGTEGSPCAYTAKEIELWHSTIGKDTTENGATGSLLS